ncbi:hypothetical protein JVT61DRAFT_15625 [Boletus reticuloceps]|uniref:Uncharacterized protein n=1 Tax=Boletus reticuloceps TaxID=495285 RepID=A0A8I2YCG9_9AGAM|nr:hypothetical protein JVT61DRAFT_15625 [Boletus reticuloceps]
MAIPFSGTKIGQSWKVDTGPATLIPELDICMRCIAFINASPSGQRSCSEHRDDCVAIRLCRPWLELARYFHFPALRLFGFGPVAAYGYGYIIKENGITCERHPKFEQYLELKSDCPSDYSVLSLSCNMSCDN